MERQPFFSYIKRHAHGITTAVVVAAASSLLTTPPETFAQNPPSVIPGSSPTPILRPDSLEQIQPTHRIDQGPFTPIFAPYPLAPVPNWTDKAQVSFYCLNGLTRSETPTRESVVATDPEYIPLGSILHIEDLGKFSAEDTGDQVKGNRIDVWISSCQEARQLGVMLKRFKIIRWGW